MTRDFTSTVNAVIAGGGNLSASVSVTGNFVTDLLVPAGWAAANITLQGSIDGGANYFNLYDDGGVELLITAAASRLIHLKIPLRGLTDLKVRSGTSGVPVAQAGGATVGVVLMPD